MLMAHSIVLRNELHDSQIAENCIQPIPIPDICPNTFKNLLKYVYGYDNISSLSFHDADNLLYAAEKYIMVPLKEKVAMRLISMLSYQNICSLMNNPACFQHPALNNAITKILQDDTKKVLHSTQFLELSPIALLKILKQDIMTVLEIEIWRAALSWAKNKAGTDDGNVLREHLEEHLKYIRLCTLTSEELCKEVVTTGVLMPYEFMMVCESVGNKKKQEGLQVVSNKLETRYDANNPTLNLLEVNFGPVNRVPRTAKFTIESKEYTVNLFSFVLRDYQFTLHDIKYPLLIQVTVIPIQSSIGATPFPRLSLMCSGYINSGGKKLKIQMMKDGTNLQLPPHTKHAITLKAVKFNLRLYHTNEKYFYHDHFTVHFMDNQKNQYFSPINKIKYTIVKQDSCAG